MKRKFGFMGKLTMAALFLATLGLGHAWAGTIVKYGIKVTYPYNFDADYDSSDDTFTILIHEGGGNLQVKALPSASYYWGGYVDVFIGAHCIDVPSINMKGRWETRFFVTGGVGWTDKLSIKYGFVGGTDFYGDQGLGMYDASVPSSISIKNGSASGLVLGGNWWICP
ncbi:MAG: hypothetical protein WHX93_05700 [bacterium]